MELRVGSSKALSLFRETVATGGLVGISVGGMGMSVGDGSGVLDGGMGVLVGKGVCVGSGVSLGTAVGGNAVAVGWVVNVGVSVLVGCIAVGELATVAVADEFALAVAELIALAVAVSGSSVRVTLLSGLALLVASLLVTTPVAVGETLAVEVGMRPVNAPEMLVAVAGGLALGVAVNITT